MGALSAVASWSLLPEVWVILALVLVGADIAFGFDFFVLSIGAAALVLAGLLSAQQNLWLGGVVLFETWHDVGLCSPGCRLVR